MKRKPIIGVADWCRRNGWCEISAIIISLIIGVIMTISVYQYAGSLGAIFSWKILIVLICIPTIYSLCCLLKQLLAVILIFVDLLLGAVFWWI